MKKLIYLFVSMLLYAVTHSQSPSSFINTSKPKSEPKFKALGPNSFWMGAQVGYKFGGTNEFADNFIVSGRLLYPIPLETKKFFLPVMGNVSTLRDAFSNEKDQNKDTIEARAQELLLSSQGINIGLYPYYELIKKDKFKLTAHSCFAWKLNAFKDKDDVIQYLDQGRFSIGIEASVGGETNGRYPLVVSVAPVITVFDSKKYETIFGTKKSSLASLEITGVIPIGKGLGLLIESVIASKPSSAFRTGIVFAAENH